MVHSQSKLVAGLMALALCLGVVVDARPAYAGEANAYFSPNGGGAAAVVDLIEAAQKTIDIGMYSVHTYKSDEVREGETLEDVAARWKNTPAEVRELNGLGANEVVAPTTRLKVMAPIFAALKRATARGVRVRMILNKAHLGSGKAKALELRAIGVQVFSQPKTIHQKFAIFDAGTPQAKLSNGSANWSVSADTDYSENTVVYHQHPRLVYQFQQEFNLLLTQDNTRPVPATAPSDQTPVALPAPPTPSALWTERAVFTSANIIQDASSTDGVVADTIGEALRSAKRKIRIEVAHFDSRAIAKALVQARWNNPALDIQVLLDMGELSGFNGQARWLEQNGIPVRYKTYSLAYLQPKAQLMHHKTVIIDDEVLITGSYNFSSTAEFKNFENSIVIRGAGNSELIAAFNGEHDRLWSMNREVYPAFRAALLAKPGDANYKRILPLHFSSSYFDSIMTLTRAEVDDYYWSVIVPLGVPNERNADYFDRETREGYSLKVVGSKLVQGKKIKIYEDLGHFLTPNAGAAQAAVGAPSAPLGGATDVLGSQALGD